MTLAGKRKKSFGKCDENYHLGNVQERENIFLW